MKPDRAWNRKNEPQGSRQKKEANAIRTLNQEMSVSTVNIRLFILGVEYLMNTTKENRPCDSPMSGVKQIFGNFFVSISGF